MRRRPYGPTAWLIDQIADPPAWAAALETLRVAGEAGVAEAAGIDDVVPAASTVLVRCARGRHDQVGRLLDTVEAAPTRLGSDEPEFVVDVVYDGDDLDEVAMRCGLSVDDVIDRHLDGVYHVAFCGFSPGFGYLRGVDEALRLPRRETPRTSVPAGAVGLAAGYTCVYPAASPGGWHLIGRTHQAVWGLDRDPPAELRPGRPVRFRRVDP